jgi:hypothetical protein
MKLLLSLMIAGSALLIAGGDIMPVEVVTKFEKMEPAPAPSRCYKPNIQKCPECDDIAEICPDDPNLPIAETVPCHALEAQR